MISLQHASYGEFTDGSQKITSDDACECAECACTDDLCVVVCSCVFKQEKCKNCDKFTRPLSRHHLCPQCNAQRMQQWRQQQSAPTAPESVPTPPLFDEPRQQHGPLSFIQRAGIIQFQSMYGDASLVVV